MKNVQPLVLGLFLLMLELILNHLIQRSQTHLPTRGHAATAMQCQSSTQEVYLWERAVLQQ